MKKLLSLMLVCFVALSGCMSMVPGVFDFEKEIYLIDDKSDGKMEGQTEYLKIWTPEAMYGDPAKRFYVLVSQMAEGDDGRTAFCRPFYPKTRLWKNDSGKWVKKKGSECALPIKKIEAMYPGNYFVQFFQGGDKSNPKDFRAPGTRWASLQVGNLPFSIEHNSSTNTLKVVELDDGGIVLRVVRRAGEERDKVSDLGKDKSDGSADKKDEKKDEEKGLTALERATRKLRRDWDALMKKAKALPQKPKAKLEARDKFIGKLNDFKEQQMDKNGDIPALQDALKRLEQEYADLKRGRALTPAEKQAADFKARIAKLEALAATDVGKVKDAKKHAALVTELDKAKNVLSNSLNTKEIDDAIKKAESAAKQVELKK